MTLNLWRQYRWPERLPAVARVIKGRQPDVVVLQEVQLDWRKSPLNQVEQLNRLLHFPYSLFIPSAQHNPQKGSLAVPPAQLGHGILSRFPVKRVEQLFLSQTKGESQRILLNFDVELAGERYPFSSIQFSDSPAGAEANLKEVLAMLALQGERRILAGGFNVVDLEKYRELYSKEYVASPEYFTYQSYPSEKTSLDHLLLPREYRFSSFECVPEKVSGHRALVARVE